MKIITWNCQMAFRKKAGFILNENPDILIVPECEHPDKLKFIEGIRAPSDYTWIGDNKNKGLGVFSYSDYRFRRLDNHNLDIKNILPLNVSNDKHDFTLFAIWANNPKDIDGAYITQVSKAIKYYDYLLTDKQTILIGDFNSNKQWDAKHWREENHSAVVDRLETKKIFSTYHHFHKQLQSEEKHKTLFMYRHEDKPYHVDYCFASIDYIDKLQNVEVGSYNDWSHLSDHTPLIVTFKV